MQEFLDEKSKENTSWNTLDIQYNMKDFEKTDLDKTIIIDCEKDECQISESDSLNIQDLLQDLNNFVDKNNEDIDLK